MHNGHKRFDEKGTAGDRAAIASKFINSTNHHVFLTGRAGTGKTTFLHEISQSTHKSAIISAPTGIAAINAGGVTLHSLFQLPFGAFIPSERHPVGDDPGFELNTPNSVIRNLKMHTTKRNMLKKLELLIIDEVSMLRADLLDAIDTVLRRVRWNNQTPFGGVQILFTGDLQQLPPVIKDPEWQVLKNYYNTPFFFGAHALREKEPVCIELDHIYRQADKKFISILNNLRDNRMPIEDMEILNSHYQPEFKANPGDGYIYLTTHNHKADRINREELEKLPGNPVRFSASVEGTFDERIYPLSPVLEIKKDAQVMFIKNDVSIERRFFNGKIGKVASVTADAVTVEFVDDSPAVRVESHTWENKRYTLNKETNEIEEKVIGTFAHLPLKLAWAITVHKSQGLTFDKAVIDVSQAFAAGQAYVALSRLTSLDGLVLSAPLQDQKLVRDPLLQEFLCRLAATEITAQSLQTASLDYIGQETKDAFNFESLWRDTDYHVKSYTKDAAHSKKQHHLDWAVTLRADLGPVKEVGDKFLKQLNNILQSPCNDITYLNQRVEAAKGYFEPILSEFSMRIKKHATLLSKEKKGVKKYLVELKDLELMFYGQLQKIYKSAALIEAFRSNGELTKACLQKKVPQREKETTVDRVSQKKKKASGSKAPKSTDTRALTLSMFNKGKTVDDIAAERSLSRLTIEGHLAYWVEQGELDVNRLVSKEAFEEITEAFELLDTTFLKPVHESFAGKYDYDLLKFTAAARKKNLASC